MILFWVFVYFKNPLNHFLFFAPSAISRESTLSIVTVLKISRKEFLGKCNTMLLPTSPAVAQSLASVWDVVLAGADRQSSCRFEAKFTPTPLSTVTEKQQSRQQEMDWTIIKTVSHKRNHLGAFMNDSVLLMYLCCSAESASYKWNPIRKREKWGRGIDGNWERKGWRECVFHQSQPRKAIWAPISEA